jgi:hypothetical protein
MARSTSRSTPLDSVIFAELQYEMHYADVHAPLVALLQQRFPNVESGLQGDSWVWVHDTDSAASRVAMDTFTAVRHQVKSAAPSALVDRVITVLAQAFDVRVLPAPVPEAEDDAGDAEG